MRYSKQREEILKVVRSTKAHPTADRVYSEVQKVLPQISLGTVYRNLNQLVEIGELSCFRDGQRLRYDGDTHGHHHFRCTRCGKLTNINIPEERFSSLLTEKHGFSVQGFSLVITGVCERCTHSPMKGDKHG